MISCPQKKKNALMVMGLDFEVSRFEVTHYTSGYCRPSVVRGAVNVTVVIELLIARGAMT